MPFHNLPPLLAEALAARGYAEPTPVQAAVLEAEADGRDLIVSAQTGSGKTVAFGLAMAAQLLDADGGLRSQREPLGAGDRADPRAGAAGQPRARLALRPRPARGSRPASAAWTRRRSGARSATARTSSSARRGGCATISSAARSTCRRCEVAVLDEADEMLDMGFREDLEEILDATPQERRTLLFSATMPQPIVALAKRYQRDALRISTVGEDRGHGDIAYQAVAVAPADIEHAVVNLLRFHEAETAMLFCATRDNVRHLHASLIERGFAAVALSGEHSQTERNHALQALRDGRARVCVATDVAARGIDLPTLSLVVHVELPRDAETLQHRSGRTGRAGKKGTAVLIVPYPRRRRVEGCCAARASTPNGSSRRRPRRSARSDRERLLATLLEPVEVDEEDRALGRAAARRAQPGGHRRRAGPRPSRRHAGARGADRQQRATARRRRTAPERPPRRASRTRSGSGWTSAAATMPIRAGSCRCCAAAATSPGTRSARSASPPTRPRSRSRAPSPAASCRRFARTASDEDGGRRADRADRRASRATPRARAGGRVRRRKKRYKAKPMRRA